MLYVIVDKLYYREVCLSEISKKKIVYKTQILEKFDSFVEKLRWDKIFLP